MSTCVLSLNGTNFPSLCSFVATEQFISVKEREDFLAPSILLNQTSEDRYLLQNWGTGDEYQARLCALPLVVTCSESSVVTSLIQHSLPLMNHTITNHPTATHLHSNSPPAAASSRFRTSSFLLVPHRNSTIKREKLSDCD